MQKGPAIIDNYLHFEFVRESTFLKGFIAFFLIWVHTRFVPYIVLLLQES